MAVSPPGGFAGFVESASGYLGQTAFLLCGDRELARDLVQEALARTYAAWWRVREPDALRYARRVLVNLHLDRVRRRTPPTGEFVEQPALEDGYSRVEDRDEVARLLASLTVQQRRVIVLRYFAQLSEAEVADCLGISVGTVKSTCSRGLASLRQQHRSVEEER